MKNYQYCKGVAAVEFAILLIPLLLIAFGTTEFGRAIYQYNALTKATRDATRYLSRFDSTSPDYPVDEAKCLVVYGSFCNDDSTMQPIAPGLTEDMVFICDRNDPTACPAEEFLAVDTSDPSQSGVSTGVINLVKVKISGYTFNSLVPFVTRFETLEFGEISTTMRQVL